MRPRDNEALWPRHVYLSSPLTHTISESIPISIVSGTRRSEEGRCLLSRATATNTVHQQQQGMACNMRTIALLMVVLVVMMVVWAQKLYVWASKPIHPQLSRERQVKVIKVVGIRVSGRGEGGRWQRRRGWEVALSLDNGRWSRWLCVVVPAAEVGGRGDGRGLLASGLEGWRGGGAVSGA